MSASDEQWLFLQDVSRLILFAASQGYKLTGGDLYRSPEYAMQHPSGVNSFHVKRQAIDLNLFIDGLYQTDTAAHKPLGEYWKSLDGANTWGGDFTRPDGNHYSRGEG